jgi:hypothetical protein
MVLLLPLLLGPAPGEGGLEEIWRHRKAPTSPLIPFCAGEELLSAFGSVNSGAVLSHAKKISVTFVTILCWFPLPAQ